MARFGRRRRRSSRRDPDPAHAGFRSALRIFGPLLIITGLIFMGMGIASFGSSFESHRDTSFPFSDRQDPTPKGPDRFWMCFVGAPLLGIGIMATKFAFLGPAARYVAHETKDSVTVIAGAVAEGIRDGYAEEEEGYDCPSCGETNDLDARFCDSCGTALSATPNCPSCGKENDAGAKFCDGCGSKLG